MNVTTISKCWCRATMRRFSPVGPMPSTPPAATIRLDTVLPCAACWPQLQKRDDIASLMRCVLFQWHIVTKAANRNEKLKTKLISQCHQAGFMWICKSFEMLHEVAVLNHIFRGFQGMWEKFPLLYSLYGWCSFIFVSKWYIDMNIYTKFPYNHTGNSICYPSYFSYLS